jgi:DNA primase
MTSAEEIKNKLDIVEVIREYLPLKRAGVNFQALCPFHNEKSPSFNISPAKQIWHCFGCGKGGDMFAFIMEKEGVDFVEALRLLAPKAGVVLQRQNPQAISERNRVMDVLDLAAAYYHSNLLNNASAKTAAAYLIGRGLNRQTIDEWQIGFSKDSWDDLILYLKSKGYSEQDMEKAGLAIKKQGGYTFFNRFRNRIMFPLRDVNANVVGFTARVLPEDADTSQGKYVNSPQTIVYDKSKLLFGLDKAKLEIKRQDLAVIVEGQMDAITAHQFGFSNVIASSGTALTGDQVQLLDRYTDNIIFALDADVAGQDATDRGSDVVNNFDVAVVEAADRYGQMKKYIDPTRSYKKNIKVAIITNGKDPDEAIRQDPKEWIRAVQSAKPLMQYYFDKLLPKLNLNDVDDKRRAVKELLPQIARLPHLVDKDHWLKQLAHRVDVDVKFLQEELVKMTNAAANDAKRYQTGVQTNKQSAMRSIAPRKRERTELLSENLLALVIKFPSFLNYILDYILPDQIWGQDNQLIYKNLVMYYNRNSKPDALDNFVVDYHAFKQWLSIQEETPEKIAKNLSLLDRLVMLSDQEFNDYTPQQAHLEIKKIIKILKIGYLSNRLKEVTSLIEQAEHDKNIINSHALNDLLQEFNNLTEEIRQNNI